MATLGNVSAAIPDIDFGGQTFTASFPNPHANPMSYFTNMIRGDAKMRSHNLRAAVRAAENPKGELAQYDAVNEKIGKLETNLGNYIKTNLAGDLNAYMPYATTEERNIAWLKIATNFHNTFNSVILGQPDFDPARRVASSIGAGSVGVSSTSGVRKRRHSTKTKRSKRG
jgi:hypothetical protein